MELGKTDMLRYILAISICGSIGLCGCKSGNQAKAHEVNNDTGPCTKKMLALSVFDYVAKDADGRDVVEGTLSLYIPPNVSVGAINGTKDLRLCDGVNATPNIGPQVGAGDIAGEESRGKIFLRLNNLADNDVVLIGDLTANDFIGIWQFRGDTGIRSQGSFVAKLQKR
jgi:hypothetical protein